MNRVRHVWTGPILMAALSFWGLVVALLLDGPLGDGAGAIGLGVPSVAVVWFLCRARRRRSSADLLVNSQRRVKSVGKL